MPLAQALVEMASVVPKHNSQNKSMPMAIPVGIEFQDLSNSKLGNAEIQASTNGSELGQQHERELLQYDSWYFRMIPGFQRSRVLT